MAKKDTPAVQPENTATPITTETVTPIPTEETANAVVAQFTPQPAPVATATGKPKKIDRLPNGTVIEHY